MRKLDLKNKRFGRLVVLEEKGRTKWGDILWLCQCDCGNMRIIQACSLANGTTRSCKCLQREKTRKLGKASAFSFGEASFNCVFARYRRHAKTSDRKFTLSKEQFRELVKQNCYYCGQEPNQIYKSQNQTGEYIYNGLDRIDNTKGYIVDNVVPCCGVCNWMKRDLSQIEFLSHVDQITKYSMVSI